MSLLSFYRSPIIPSNHVGVMPLLPLSCLSYATLLNLSNGFSFDLLPLSCHIHWHGRHATENVNTVTDQEGREHTVSLTWSSIVCPKVWSLSFTCASILCSVLRNRPLWPFCYWPLTNLRYFAKFPTHSRHPLRCQRDWHCCDPWAPSWPADGDG